MQLFRAQSTIADEIGKYHHQHGISAIVTMVDVLAALTEISLQLPEVAGLPDPGREPLRFVDDGMNLPLSALSNACRAIFFPAADHLRSRMLGRFSALVSGLIMASCSRRILPLWTFQNDCGRRTDGAHLREGLLSLVEWWLHNRCVFASRKNLRGFSSLARRTSGSAQEVKGKKYYSGALLATHLFTSLQVSAPVSRL